MSYVHTETIDLRSVPDSVVLRAFYCRDLTAYESFPGFYCIEIRSADGGDVLVAVRVPYHEVKPGDELADAFIEGCIVRMAYGLFGKGLALALIGGRDAAHDIVTRALRAVVGLNDEDGQSAAQGDEAP